VRFTVKETLAATAEALFDVISDPRRRPEWQTTLVSVHVSTEGPPALGTVWHEFTRGGLRFDLEITEFERPLRWAEEAQGTIANARLAVSFDSGPTAGSTRVGVYVEVDFKGPLKLAGPLVKVVMPVALRADLRRAEGLAQALMRG
jgi:Polyketide cyclase / dehydrase and lipid transport